MARCIWHWFHRFVCAALLTTVPSLAQATSCNLNRVASLDLVSATGPLVVPITLNGRASRLMVDTGTPIGVLSKNVADELKLKAVPLRGMAMSDSGGKAFQSFVEVQSVQLDQSTARKIPFLVATGSLFGSAIFDGILGADLLSRYDIELDFAAGKINWFSQGHCKGEVVYWSKDYVSIPFQFDAAHKIIFPVTLDGQKLTALFDTGATSSSIGEKTTAHLFGVNPAAGDSKPTDKSIGANGSVVSTFRHRFEKLDLGGIEIHNTEVRLTPEVAYSPPIGMEKLGLQQSMVVGLSHLRKLRIYIAYGEQVLYVTVAGAH